jgi:SSS family solute:Na+ symporter
MPVYASAVTEGHVDYVSKYIGADFNVVLLVVGGLAALFVVMGGLKGIMYADAFQGAVMFAGMAYLILYTYSMLGGVTKAHAALSQLRRNPALRNRWPVL